VGQIVPLETLSDLGARLRAAGQCVVLTNGHFDLLHVGHLRSLQAARELGDVLIVAINNDLSTTRRKGPGRPVVPEDERAELIAALTCVDYVTIFGEVTAERVVSLLRPDVYAKGGDYAASAVAAGPHHVRLPEAAVVQSYGGQVEMLPLVPGRSTTMLARKLRDLDR
jgi:rfaE bifunctional protein nucleotidyltransferase chain/domain